MAHDKFTSTPVCDFGDLAVFFGGLERAWPPHRRGTHQSHTTRCAGLIGSPKPSLEKALRAEHCDEPAGSFGASNEPFTSPNYSVTSTASTSLRERCYKRVRLCVRLRSMPSMWHLRRWLACAVRVCTGMQALPLTSLSSSSAVSARDRADCSAVACLRLIGSALPSTSYSPPLQNG